MRIPCKARKVTQGNRAGLPDAHCNFVNHAVSITVLTPPYLEALGRFDILQVDGSKRRLKSTHDGCQFLGIFLVDLYVHRVYAGELFKENRSAESEV
jgi:hypothetical protein